MAEIKFFCPHCKQKISCDELWGGHQLQCPSCQREVTVPQSQAAPVPSPAAPPVRVSVHTHGSAVPGPPPPPSAQPKLSLGRPQHAQPSESGASPPPRSTPVYRAIAPPVQKKGGPKKWVTIGAIVVALGVGGYFGFGWLMQYQEKVNAKRRQVEKNSDGGEMGHIANVYEVLDATDPDREEKGGGTSREGVPRQPRGGVGKPIRGAVADGDDGAAKPEGKELPVIPAVWTLDVAAAKIPESRANGRISGSNFVVQTASLVIGGNAHVLSLRQGAGVSPDREILVYLHPKPSEPVAGHTWTVSKDMKGPSVPQVAKRWKTNPKFAPQQKNFPAGYAMKLEFGQINEGEIPGKIFIGLPDAEQSVVAGVFKAATSLANTASPTASPATPTPTPTPKVDPAFEKRYGIKR